MMQGRLGYVLRMFPQISETFIANEIVELERLGYDIHICSYRRPREAVLHECVRSVRAPIDYLPDPLYRHPMKIIRANRTLYNFEPGRYQRVTRYVLMHSLKRFNPDAWRRLLQAICLANVVRDRGIVHLHAHFAHRATQVTMLASMLTGIPFSFSAHAKDIYAARTADLREKIRGATFVATCTRANQTYLQQLVDPEDRAKIHLAYHGIDPAKFAPNGRRCSGEAPLILSVGRLVDKKGLPYLLEACRMLKSEGQSFRCVIVGEGPQRGALEGMVRSVGLGGLVDLPGAVSQERVLDLYRQAAVFALPCQVMGNGDRDGIPNVLVEAMAVGLPVISTAISGIPELITSGHDGLLVPERDVQALTSAIQTLLQDDALRESLGRRARSLVARKFDSRINALGLATLFSREALDTSWRAELAAAVAP